MITREGSTKIVNFMTAGAGVLMPGRGHISHIAKMHYFLEIVFSTPRHRTEKVYMYILMMTKEGSIEIAIFMTSGPGVFVPGCGHISNIVKLHLKFLLYSSSIFWGMNKLSA